jgi:HK97 family phage portal protein
MRFYEKWLDNTLRRIGYAKASGWVPTEVVFESEAPTAQRLEFDQWTDEQKERLAITLSWVFSDIQLISGEAAQAELGIYEREGERLTEVLNHPFELLLQRPFPFWPRSLTMRYTLMWWLLRGEAYWWKIFDGGGELRQLLPVPAGRMRPIPDAKEYISGFAYKPKHGKPAVKIPKEQVVFFRFPNPFDFHRGLSPRTGYQLPLETDVAAQRWNRETFTKEATLRTLIALPAELDSKVYTQAKEEILRELVEERRRYMVARSGKVEVKALGMSPKELEFLFLGGREFTREEIDRVFGVPAGFWAKEATRANSEAAKATLIENTVWPLLVLMHDAITEQIVIPHYGDNLRARFQDIRPRDRNLLVRERQQYWQVMKVNEARQDLNLEPLEDEELGEMLVPLATRGPAGGGFGGGVGPQIGKAANWQISKSADQQIGENGSHLKAVKEELRKWRSKARRAGDDVEFVSEVIPPTLAGMVKAFVGRLGAEEGFRFLKAAPDGRDAVERRLLKRIKAILERWLGVSATEIEEGREPDYGELGGELRLVLEPELEDIATEVAIRESMEVGVQFDPAVINVAAADWARTYSYELIGGLTETTRGVVSRAMQQFIEMAGMTREQLEALLRPAFGEMRASMIAVTEVTRAYSAATRMYANFLEMDAGIRMEGMWNTRNDELVCPVCGPLNGQPESVWRDAFRDGPPAHPFCRCWTTLRKRRES